MFSNLEDKLLSSIINKIYQLEGDTNISTYFRKN